MRDLAVGLLLKMIGKEGETMMAMFFAQRVILGKTAYKDGRITDNAPPV